MRSLVVALLVMGVACAGASGAGAQPAAAPPRARAVSGPAYGSQLGWGLGAVGANVFYVPVKLAYAAAGAVIGAAAYGLTAGKIDVAHRIWSPSLGGTYVLSPAMLRGEEPIFFSGESYD